MCLNKGFGLYLPINSQGSSCTLHQVVWQNFGVECLESVEDLEHFYTVISLCPFLFSVEATMKKWPHNEGPAGYSHKQQADRAQGSPKAD